MSGAPNKSRTRRAQPKPPDVLRQLGRSLPRQWRQYRQRLKRCREHFSEPAVHRARIAARRLLAIIELLEEFISERRIAQARADLKAHLDSFDQLRDTQVQLRYVRHLVRAFPAARKFRRWLRKRETRAIRQTHKAVRKIKTRRLGKRLGKFEKELRRCRKKTPSGRALLQSQQAVRRAFDRVVELRDRVQAAHPRTIHRTRVAFKRFRYMVEALSPLRPTRSDEPRRAMRAYQASLGDIQDLETLLAALDEFIAEEENDRELLHLRAEFVRRREQLILACLHAGDPLSQFRPGSNTPGRPAFTPSQPP